MNIKQLVILIQCLFFLVLSGCGGPAGYHRGVDVIVTDGGQFPEHLAGRWKDEEKGWEFVFEPNGMISSAVIDSGFIEVIPAEGIASKPMKVGKAVYKLGIWTVQYSPQNRELAIEVVVDDFHVDLGKDALEGSSTDFFCGPVTEDGQKWTAEWISFPKYIALTPEPTELPVDPNETITTLIFKKVTD